MAERKKKRKKQGKTRNIVIDIRVERQSTTAISRGEIVNQDDPQVSEEVNMADKAKPLTKSAVYGVLADKTGMSKKEVTVVMDALTDLIGDQIGKKGPGVFNVPGLMKITVQHKPATKARKGTNPFTGEETMFKAKPARNVVKIRPLKGLKDMV